MIIDDIRNRMKLTGIPNTKLAELIGSNPAQISLFLKGEGASLKTNTLQRCFDELGIDTSIYTKRYELALDVVSILTKKAYKDNDVVNMTKNEMAKICDKQQIRLFIDADEKKFNDISKYGIIDFESTYPFFQSMVLQLMGTKGKHTSTSVAQSWGRLAMLVGVLPFVGGIADLGVGLVRSSLKGAGVITPLLMITRYIIKNRRY